MKFIVSHDTLTQAQDRYNAELNVLFCQQDSDFSTLPLKNSKILDKLKANSKFSAKMGESLPLYHEGHDELIIGLGTQNEQNERKVLAALHSLAAQIKAHKVKTVAIEVDGLVCAGRTVHWLSQKLVEALSQSLYQYDHTKSEKADISPLQQIILVTKENNLTLAIETGQAVAHGVNVAKALGNLPGNICTPSYLADQAVALGKVYDDISVEILDENKLTDLGMGAFMSVSKGSTEPGKLIAIHYKGTDASTAPHVLVGKGITFDTGGISLKPGAGMEEMKFDMCGAASVMGMLNVLGELKPAINVIGVIAAAENMPAGNASKPGDVVTTMSGKTIEIINTDAEGRLVLCDALTWVEQFEPASVVDIATLTGAAIIALGHHPSAIYANDDALQQELVNAGIESWDRGWAMPLWDEYKDELTSNFADLRNLGNVARAGGSITAAAFLSKFTEKYKWAHLDIAGTAWTSGKNVGATGRPVALLTQYLLSKID